VLLHCAIFSAACLAKPLRTIAQCNRVLIFFLKLVLQDALPRQVAEKIAQCNSTLAVSTLNWIVDLSFIEVFCTGRPIGSNPLKK